MLASTKFQVHLVRIDESLPPLTSTLKKWALKHCLMHKAVQLKSGKTTCLDCGQHWLKNFDRRDCKCELTIEDTRKKVFTDESYFTKLTTHKGFQVIRKFKVTGKYHSGFEPQLSVVEVSRIYIREDGKFGIIGYSFMQNFYGERWFGEFGLKHNKSIGNHNFTADYLNPRIKVLPVLKRNGFIPCDIYPLTYFNFFYAILTNYKSETLLKAQQIPLFVISAQPHRNKMIEEYWQSIKICMRQNYLVENGNDWFDYLELLDYFGKDLKNPFYVCPTDFKKSHNKFVEKKRKELLKKKIENMKKELEEDQKNYRQTWKDFFELRFMDGELTVEVIKGVKKVMELGDLFRHCIYTNEYHKKDRLLLYAMVDNIPIETIEFDLTSYKVVQSRGFENQASEFNQKIVKLVNNHSKEIRRLAECRKKSA